AVRAFLAAGAPFGLRDTAVVTAYGMAEATLGVAFHPWGTPLAIDVVDAAQLEEELRAVPVPGADEHDAARASGEGSSGPAGPEDGVIPGDGAAPGRDAAVQTRSFPLLGPPLPGIEVVARRADGT